MRFAQDRRRIRPGGERQAQSITRRRDTTMSSKTKRVLVAALMLGAASGALASDNSSYSDGTVMGSDAHAVAAPKAKREITRRAYGANAYRIAPAPRRRPERDRPHLNCDLPIGC
jgi:hypothetical protein